MSLLLAHLSYQFIEVPTRQYLTQANRKKEVILIGLITFALALIATSIQQTTFNNRLPPAIELAANEALNKSPRRTECHDAATYQHAPGCIYGAESANPASAILLGDSHAASVVTALGVAAKKANKSLVEWSLSACQPLLGVQFAAWKNRNPSNQCAIFNQWALDTMRSEHPHTPLVLVSRFSVAIYGNNEALTPNDRVNIPSIYFSKPYASSFDPDFISEYEANFVQSVCQYAQSATGEPTRQVYLVRPIPEMGVDVPKILSRNKIFNTSNNDIKITLEAYHQRHQLVWAAQNKAAEKCGAKILNPLPYLCDTQYCYGSKNGRPLYFDDDHLNEYGNKFLTPMFEVIFNNAQ